MKKFFEKYGLWLLGILTIPILLTWLWFSVDGFISPGIVEPEHWLNFWGGYLAFFGAIFLGFVAIWQNKKAHEQADDANKINQELLGLAKKANEQTDNANEINRELLGLNKKLLNLELQSKRENYSHFSFTGVEVYLDSSDNTVEKIINNDVKEYTFSDYTSFVSKESNNIDILLWEEESPAPNFGGAFGEPKNVLSCQYEHNFCVSFTAKNSCNLLINKIYISGISVAFRHKDGFKKSSWYANDRERFFEVDLKKYININRDAHSFSVSFKLFSTSNELFCREISDQSIARIDFDKIFYTNIIGVTSECSQVINLVATNANMQQINPFPMKFAGEYYFKIDDININDLEELKHGK